MNVHDYITRQFDKFPWARSAFAGLALLVNLFVLYLDLPALVWIVLLPFNLWMYYVFMVR